MNKFKIFFYITAIFSCIILLFSAFKKNDYSHFTYECDKIILRILDKNNIDAQKPFQQKVKKINKLTYKSAFLEKTFTLPPQDIIEVIEKDLAKIFPLSKFRIGEIKSKKSKDEKIHIVDFYFEKIIIYRLILKEKIAKGKLAIILDDWGYNKKIFKSALDLNVPITYAILPNLPYSHNIAAQLKEAGHEFILHLPTEPEQTKNAPLEKNTLLTAMTKDEIIAILKHDIASLPGLKGINNHMGSKLTSDETTMRIILDEIKKNNLYFLDSYTTDKSVAGKIALKNNVLFLKRDLFIDTINNKKTIKEQLLKAKQIAENTGKAIAIGHAKYKTINILKEVIPQFQKEGFKFVYLSRFLKQSE